GLQPHLLREPDEVVVLVLGAGDLTGLLVAHVCSLVGGISALLPLAATTNLVEQPVGRPRRGVIAWLWRLPSSARRQSATSRRRRAALARTRRSRTCPAARRAPWARRPTR